MNIVILSPFRPSNSHGFTVRLTVSGLISRSHGLASKSHGFVALGSPTKLLGIFAELLQLHTVDVLVSQATPYHLRLGVACETNYSIHTSYGVKGQLSSHAESSMHFPEDC